MSDLLIFPDLNPEYIQYISGVLCIVRYGLEFFFTHSCYNCAFIKKEKEKIPITQYILGLYKIYITENIRMACADRIKVCVFLHRSVIDPPGNRKRTKRQFQSEPTFRCHDMYP